MKIAVLTDNHAVIKTRAEHGHFDHTNGLDPLKGGNLLCHPSGDNTSIMSPGFIVPIAFFASRSGQGQAVSLASIVLRYLHSVILL